MSETDKGTRLLELYMRFTSGAHLTIKQIIKEYGTNRRTVQRDLEMLREVGKLNLAFDTDENFVKTWYLEEKYRKIGVTYSIPDVMALFLGRSMFDFLEDTLLEDSICRIYKQIEDKLKNPKDRLKAEIMEKKIFLIHEGPKKLKKKSQQILDTCLDGLIRDERLKINYLTSKGENRSHTVHPYTLTAYKRGLYLLGFIEEKKEIRVLAMERIKRAIHQKDDKFDYPNNFDPKIFFKKALFIVPGKPEQVELVFAPTSKPFIEIRHFHESQKIRVLKDGSIQMKLRVPINFETVNFVLSFGKYAEVIQPESLREQVKQHLREALKHYRFPHPG